MSSGAGEEAHASPLVSVVVPVLNKQRFLERCLGSVLAAAEAAPGTDVVVVDHGSTDGSFKTAEALCRQRAVVVQRPGGTIAALRNAGANLTTAPLLCFLDCDCVVAPDYFTALCEILARPDVAATGCRVDYPDNGPWVERVWHLLHAATDDAEGFRPYLNSGNFALRRAAFDAVGGFDETLTTGEDAELGQRLNDAGFRIYESRRLAVQHLDNPQTLPAFFRKEVWHGLGMFGTVRLTSIDRPTAMMVLHVVMLVSAVLIVTASGFSLPARLAAAVACAFFAPFLTVLYRTRLQRVPVLPALVLYQVYYLARLTALGEIAWRRFTRQTG